MNGTVSDLDPGCTVAQLVAARSRTDQGIAVAVNDQVVTKASWAGVVLTEDDRVEILTAVQGG